MKKIISLFQRNYDTDRLVRDEVVPGAEWVIDGEGIATRKFNGTCCMYRDGKLFKRYDAKRGKTPPVNFEPAQDYDPVTGHMPGWIPVGDGPEDTWHREAHDSAAKTIIGVTGPIITPDGTYELCGPKVQGNPDNFPCHVLIKHGAIVLGAPRDFNGLREYLAFMSIEGIVWHHPDGRMVKIKTKDFGLKR